MENIPELKIIITTKFEIGDLICNVKNYLSGMPLFFTAYPDDVKHYSNKNRKYYKIIKNV